MMNVTTDVCEALLGRRIGNGCILALLFITVCEAGNIFLLVVIKQTPTLKGFSGLLLLNNEVVHFVEHVVFLILLLLACISHDNNHSALPLTVAIHYVVVLKQTWMTLSLFLLLGISFNLYVAICKSTMYSQIITVKRGYIFIIISWVVSLTLGLSPLFGGSENDECLDLTSLWLTILHLMYGVWSLAGNAWFLHKVLKHRPPLGSRSRSTQEKLKLTKFIFILYISNALTFIALNMANSFRVSLTSRGLDYLVFAIHVVSRAYSIARPCYLLVLYRPLWETTKTLLRCRPRRPPNTVAPSIIPITAARPSQRINNSGQVD
ncbi:adenosine receptor A2a-like [Haliotis rubra]|uniref:adenosine receptor A2a-like n=1 Tax=Haliotis rubra TaxID=36100 RepID=UPI001EE5492A|nr:adenosine receptor A2a-like [Haliotis rubra]